MINLAASLILAYFIGCIPTSFIFTKIIKGKDIRQHGSGNAGATNVFRVVGKLPALFVLIIDVFKGSFAVFFLREIFFNNAIGVTIGFELYGILLGICAIGGHVWNVFLGLKGGKGVATTAGVLLILAPDVLAASFIVWVFVFFLFRFVSVASVISGMFLPVFAIMFRDSIYLVSFCAFLCVMGAFKHKANIRRLIRGEEKKIF